MGYCTETLLEKSILGSLSGCLHSSVCQASSYHPPQMFKATIECWVWFACSRIPKIQEIVLKALINGDGSFCLKVVETGEQSKCHQAARFGGEGIQGNERHSWLGTH